VVETDRHSDSATVLLCPSRVPTHGKIYRPIITFFVQRAQCRDIFVDEDVKESSQRQVRATEIQGRSLPETPTLSMAQQRQGTGTPTPMSSRRVSMVDVYSYINLTEGPQADPERLGSSGLREAISSAGEDELRALLSNVVSTLENGLLPTERPTERQTYYDFPGNRLALLVLVLSVGTRITYFVTPCTGRAKKSNPLGKIRYLWNCNKFFRQIYSFYR